MCKMTTPNKKIEILHQKIKVLLKKPHIKKKVFLEKEMGNGQEAMIRRKHQFDEELVKIEQPLEKLNLKKRCLAGEM